MNIYKSICILMLSFGLVGCNSEQLPIDSKVSISPSSKNLTISSEFENDMFCFTENGLYQDVPLLISVTDGQGAPVGNTEVEVYADFADNSFNGVGVLQLYSDANSNGVIDEPEELVTSSSSGVYKAETGKYNGSTSLMLRMFLTCPYDGEIYVFAGSSSFTMDVGVSYTGSSDQSTGDESVDVGDEGDTDEGTSDGVSLVE